MKTKAAVVNKLHGEFEITTLQLDENIKADEILVRIVACGVCHSELGVVEGHLEFPFPCVLGHEGAGIVEKIGNAVKTVAPGDKVLMSIAHCRTNCKACRRGEPMQCATFYPLNYSGVRRDGATFFQTETGDEVKGNWIGQSAFANYTVVEESVCIKVPPESDLTVLASVGCGQITGAGAVLHYLKPKSGTTIAIFGVGAVGCAAILASTFSPLVEIIAVDIVASRLDIAKELGATITINGREVKDVPAKIIELTEGGVDYAVECSGNPTALKQAYASLAKGGVLGSVGVTPPGVTQDIVAWEHIVNSRSYLGCVMGNSVPHEFVKTIVKWHSQGKWPLEKFSKQFKFDEVTAAFDAMKDGSVIKPILVW